MVSPESVSSPRILRPYQHEAVEAVKAAWASDPDARPGVVLPTGAGKQQPVTTLIPTPHGLRQLGSLRSGDEVFTGDGSVTHITATHEQGMQTVVRMHFDDQTFVDSGPEHLWRVFEIETVSSKILSSSTDPSLGGAIPAAAKVMKETLVWKTITTAQIEESRDLGNVFHVPMSGVAQYTGSTLSDDPYTLGRKVYLASFDASSEHEDGFSHGVPEEYLLSVESARRSLLSGVLHGSWEINGTSSRRSHDARWGDSSTLGCTHSEMMFSRRQSRLLGQVKQLVWSLGGKAVQTKSPVEEDAGRITLVVAMPDRYSEEGSMQAGFCRTITSIERLPAPQRCRCITVSHPSGLYLTGPEHIVTHNSTVIAKLATDARADGKRVVLLAHRGELLDQMSEAVAAVDPGGEEVGVVAGRRNAPDTAIVAASFQTLSRSKRLAQLGPRDLVLADECHHITANTFRKVLVDLGALADVNELTGDILSPATSRTAGFTATMTRADDKHLGQVWSQVAYERDVLWAIDNGHLVAPRGKVVRLEGLNKLASIKNQHGDYRVTELNDVMAASVPTTIDSVLRHASGRTPIIFAVSVAHAEMISEELCRRGFPSRSVTGNMTLDRRSEVYEGFRDGTIKAMVTVAVLTEGADFPMCDTVVMARPTRSQVLYCQIIGRALRPYPGKTDALVIDLTGASRDKSMVTLTQLHPSSESVTVDAQGHELPDAEEDDGGERPARKERLGTVELEDIDLLKRSTANWLQTPAGVRFLDARSVYIFVWPPNPSPEDQCMLGRVVPNSRKFEWFNDSSGEPIVSSLSDAVTAAEWFADHVYHNLTKNTASRKRNIAPSSAQISYAHILGIPDADSKTRARLSDDISIVKASRCLPVPLGWTPEQARQDEAS